MQKNKKLFFFICNISVYICGGRTVPVLPRVRWLICCVRGPNMAVGWMVMVWSTEGVRTVPCAQERKEVRQVQKGALGNGEAV